MAQLKETLDRLNGKLEALDDMAREEEVSLFISDLNEHFSKVMISIIFWPFKFFTLYWKLCSFRSAGFIRIYIFIHKMKLYLFFPC